MLIMKDKYNKISFFNKIELYTNQKLMKVFYFVLLQILQFTVCYEIATFGSMGK